MSESSASLKSEEDKDSLPLSSPPQSPATAAGDALPEKGTPCSYDSLIITVIIWFRPTGNAPVLKQSKFRISIMQRFQAITDFLRKQLHFQNDRESLVLF